MYYLHKLSADDGSSYILTNASDGRISTSNTSILDCFTKYPMGDVADGAEILQKIRLFGDVTTMLQVASSVQDVIVEELAEFVNYQHYLDKYPEHRL